MGTEPCPSRSILTPYDGAHHSLPGGCPKALATFSGDTSGLVAYSFNSLGFRGEEFEPAAVRHLFVSGCSIAFGLGLDYEDAWVSVFRRAYAEIHGISTGDVNLQNFSTSGCGNGYISRTLIGQCTRFRPSLALATLTFPDRAELLHAGRSYNIGRWCLKDSFDEGMEADGHHQELRQLIRRKAQAHYDLYTLLAGEQDLLKNALLLQWFFESRGLPYLLGIVRTGEGQLPSHERLAPWCSLLDPERVFAIPLQECLVDVSASPWHPGPEGSRVIAEKFLCRYRALYAPPATAAAEAAAGLGSNRAPGVMTTHEDPNVYPLF